MTSRACDPYNNLYSGLAKHLQINRELARDLMQQMVEEGLVIQARRQSTFSPTRGMKIKAVTVRA